MRAEARLFALAESIADGRAVDWDAAESDLNDDQRAVVRQLRFVSELAVLHRTLPIPPEDAVTRPGPARDMPVRTAVGTWGPLQLLERLGGGTSGEVYRAWDRDLEREVALKLLRAEDPDGNNLLTSRITAEARLLARMRHTNVVVVHGVASHDGRVGLWMELVQGGTLEDFITARGPMGARDAALVGIEICRALAAIHAAGLVHRDIKTQNVMREDGGRIVLMDLGTGRELTPEHASVPRDVAGTPLYIAPEIFAGEPASVRTDLYSVGVLLYRLVTASFPVQAMTIEELRAEHAAGHATSLRDARGDLPPAFIRVIDRALARHPEDRQASAAALQADLARTLEETETTRTEPGTKRGAWWWTGAGVLLLAALLGGRQWFISRPAPALSTVHSLVVLPLQNVSGDAAHDYLADGMTEELIAALGYLEGLNVISRTSAMRFKGTRTPIPEIARALHVDAALEGAVSVIRGGDGPSAPPNRVRVTARLIYAGTDTQIWNETFEVALTDVVELRRRIAKAVAEGINLHLNPEQQNPPANGAADIAARQDPAVFDLYLRGRYEWNKRTEEGIRRSILYFQEAIDRDPKFARAYAGLADAYTFMVLSIYAHAPRGDAVARATTAATTALTLDDALAEPHASLGLLAELRFDWSTAEQYLRRAVTAKPSYGTAHHWLADLLSKRGLVPEAIDHINTALAVDPLSTSVNAEAGGLQIFARNYDAAIAQLEKTVRMDPTFAKGHLALAEVYGYKRDFTRALAEVDAAAALMSDPVTDGTKGYILAAAGRRAEAQRLADDLAGRYARQEPDVAAALAAIHAGLGQNDDALTWLERAMERQEPWVSYIAVDPRFDTLRGDARFANLLARVGLAR